MIEEQFYQKGNQILDFILENWPVLATQMGVHSRDDQFSNKSREAMKKANHKFNKFLKDISGAEVESFSKEGQIDHRILVQFLKSVIREYEERQSYQRNPQHYIDEIFGGIMTLIMKDFAPLEVRLKSLLGRIEEIPEVLNQARRNLEPRRVPEVWIDTGLEQLSMAPGLFKKLLPQMAAKHVPKLENQYSVACERAAEAVSDFVQYLKQEVKPVAEGHYAAGEDMFNKLLHENHMVDYDAKELLEKGWKIFEETEEEMEILANKIDPDKTPREILEGAKEDHPAEDELLDVYRNWMKKSRDFVINNDIATIPAEEKLKVVETPQYLRPVIPYAAYMQPGIFEEELEGLFMVTPVNDGASEKGKEAKLRGHFYGKLPITTLHEGYPGHHLQLVWSVKEGSNLRKLGTFLSTLFVEGWAFYCEEMMEKLGYIDSPIQKLGRLSEQLWRAARIILDVRLHCQGMKVEEAVDFLVSKCQLEPDNALVEVRRYTSSPTQPQSYLMGKEEILKIINKYKEKYPEKTMQEIHDDILKAGSLPPRLLERHLFAT